MILDRETRCGHNRQRLIGHFLSSTIGIEFWPTTAGAKHPQDAFEVAPAFARVIRTPLARSPV
jgi:hypothetical protein